MHYIPFPVSCLIHSSIKPKFFHFYGMSKSWELWFFQRLLASSQKITNNIVLHHFYLFLYIILLQLSHLPPALHSSLKRFWNFRSEGNRTYSSHSLPLQLQYGSYNDFNAIVGLNLRGLTTWLLLSLKTGLPCLNSVRSNFPTRMTFSCQLPSSSFG